MAKTSRDTPPGSSAPRTPEPPADPPPSGSEDRVSSERTDPKAAGAAAVNTAKEKAAEVASKPEVMVGVAFAGGFVGAQLLKVLGRS